LIEIVRAAKRVTIENGTLPTVSSLSEAEEAKSNAFLADMLLIYPLIGVRAFEVVQPVVSNATSLRLRGKGTDATGFDRSEGFVVQHGSRATKLTMASMPGFARDLRSKLLGNSVLIDDGATYRFSQDYVFSSPSTAAMILLGRSANGRLEWKGGSGLNLRAIQELEAGPTSDA
jgi:hypothetical protein